MVCVRPTSVAHCQQCVANISICTRYTTLSRMSISTFPATSSISVYAQGCQNGFVTLYHLTITNPLRFATMVSTLLATQRSSSRTRDRWDVTCYLHRVQRKVEGLTLRFSCSVIRAAVSHSFEIICKKTVICSRAEMERKWSSLAMFHMKVGHMEDRLVAAIV